MTKIWTRRTEQPDTDLVHGIGQIDPIAYNVLLRHLFVALILPCHHDCFNLCPHHCEDLTLRIEFVTCQT